MEWSAQSKGEDPSELKETLEELAAADSKLRIDTM